MVSFCCQCQNRGGGYTNIGTEYDQWWVHVICSKPTEAWVRGHAGAMLNYFKGGPLDATVYETTTLLSSSYTMPIDEYKWTTRLITSQKTGQRARVWLHKTVHEQEPAANAGNTGTASPNGKVTPMTDVQVENEQPVNAPEQPVNEDVQQPAPEQPQADVQVEAGTPLLDRRKELKLSRKQVADFSGITQAKIYRIELGGPRTTDDERQALSDALEALGAQVASNSSAGDSNEVQNEAQGESNPS